MFCVECGNQVPEGGRFCQMCGARAPLEEPAAASPQAPVVPTTPAAGPEYAQQRVGPTPARRRAGLVPGAVAAAIILLAGLAVGLFFGFRGDGTPTVAQTTDTAVVASSTTQAPATTTSVAASTTSVQPATTTTQPSTTTTTERPTTTTEDRGVALTARVTDWMHLLESIPTSSKDLTAQVASFLTPKDTAKARAADYIKDWKTASDPEAIIKEDVFDRVVSTTISPDGSLAWALCTFKVECRDGRTTRAFEMIDWKLDDGQWKRTAEYKPTTPVKGQVVPFGGAVRSGYLVWAPEIVRQFKHLAAKGGPTAKGTYMSVEFYIKNEGPAPLAPASFQVTAIGKDGKKYSPSSAADQWWDVDAEDRKTKIAAGELTYLWYTFDVPDGTDSRTFQFQVTLPGI